MRRWWLPVAGVTLAIVAINAAGWLVTRAVDEGGRMPGLVAIRPPSEVSALALSGDTLYAGGRAGLYAIDTKTRRVTRPVSEETLPLGQVRALLLDPDGGLWIGHETGLTLLRDGVVRTYTTSDGLPADRVRSLLRVRDGRLLVGTVDGAAVAETTAAVPTFRPLDAPLDDLLVHAMYESGDGTLYVGTYNAPKGGVFVRSDGRWYALTPADGLPHANVTSFADAGDGNVWAGTGFHDRGGAVRIAVGPGAAPRIAATLLRSDGLAGEKVRTIFRDRRGMLWFGSERDGIAVRDGSTFAGALTETDGLSDDEVKSIAEGADGRLWFGTRNGITLVEDPEGVLARWGAARGD